MPREQFRERATRHEIHSREATHRPVKLMGVHTGRSQQLDAKYVDRRGGQFGGTNERGVAPLS